MSGPVQALRIPILTKTSYRALPLRVHPTQSHLRFTAEASHCLRASRRAHTAYKSAPVPVSKSGTGFYTAVVVFGIAVGGALLYPALRGIPGLEEGGKPSRRISRSIDYSTLTDSYLVMAPNTPPGRPGTLTPEEEGKLRELWAATSKVFGIHSRELVELNGVDTPIEAETTAPSVTDASETPDKEKKKKSRLNVFKRHKDKGDKSTSESNPPSGSATPSDISSLSIADEDDKYGQNKDFKAALANTSPEQLRQTFWSMVKHDHPDALLLRFLRARKWNVENALVMMISTMHWRATDMHVDDDIIKNGELKAVEDTKSSDPAVKKEAEDFLAQMRMGKSFLHGVDKEGRPLCIVRARLHRQGEQSEASLERYTVYTIETARMLLRPPVDTATIVFDMTGFSMANMDYAPVKFMIKCFEANYPESLGTVLVYKAPWVFNAIWTIIRGWLDPVVAGKVHFCKQIDDLEGFVPRNQIPKELGGDEQWEYKYQEPLEGENRLLGTEGASQRDELESARQLLVKKYESTILDWVHAGEAGKSLEERRAERDAVAEELRSNYWKLDPFVRARTLYDRTGVIYEGGKLDFYNTNKEIPPPSTAGAGDTHPDLD